MGHQCFGRAEQEVDLQDRYSFQIPSHEDWKSRTARWVAVSSPTTGRQAVCLADNRCDEWRGGYYNTPPRRWEGVRRLSPSLMACAEGFLSQCFQ